MHAPDLAIGPDGHQGRFRQRRRAVVERGVGDLHTGQAGHHGLEFIDELQRALARLRLVGRVGAVEFTAGGDLPHGRRHVVIVCTGPHETQRTTILLGTLQHQAGDFLFVQPFRHTRQLSRPQAGGDLIKQGFYIRCTDGREHFADIGFRVGDKWHGGSGFERLFR